MTSSVVILRLQSVYSDNKPNSKSMITGTMTSTLLKGCDRSSENTDQSEWLEFEDLPNFIIVNRYKFNSTVSKNKSFININIEL